MRIPEMSRRASSPVWSLLCACSLPLAAFALLAVAPPAHAGLGDMMKKAKDKALQTTSKKVEADSPASDAKCKPVFDEVTLELTDARVQRIIAAFNAAGKSAAGRPALVEKLNNATDERSALYDKHNEAISKAQEKRVEVEGCYHNGYQTAQQRRAQEYSQRALTDPKLMEKFSKLAAENNAAAAKGDTAAQKRMNDAMAAEYLPTKDDTAQVRKQCGPIPPKSAAEIRMEELDKLTRDLENEIAKLDEKVMKEESDLRGMDGQAWFMALERIHMYMGWKDSKAKNKGDVPCGLTAAETQALDKYHDQLKAVLGG
jgi:predicted  nucleic acid-binding Zn-ribbon protein